MSTARRRNELDPGTARCRVCRTVRPRASLSGGECPKCWKSAMDRALAGSRTGGALNGRVGRDAWQQALERRPNHHLKAGQLVMDERARQPAQVVASLPEDFYRVRYADGVVDVVDGRDLRLIRKNARTAPRRPPAASTPKGLAGLHRRFVKAAAEAREIRAKTYDQQVWILLGFMGTLSPAAADRYIQTVTAAGQTADRIKRSMEYGIEALHQAKAIVAAGTPRWSDRYVLVAQSSQSSSLRAVYLVDVRTGSSAVLHVAARRDALAHAKQAAMEYSPAMRPLKIVVEKRTVNPSRASTKASRERWRREAALDSGLADEGTAALIRLGSRQRARLGQHWGWMGRGDPHVRAAGAYLPPPAGFDLATRKAIAAERRREAARVPKPRLPNPTGSRVVSSTGAFAHEALEHAPVDPRSIRTVTSGAHRVRVGCPEGAWQPREKRCKKGLVAVSVLHPKGERRRNLVRAGRTKTGGPSLQRRVLDALQAAGWTVREHARVGMAFPPGTTARTAQARYRVTSRHVAAQVLIMGKHLRTGAPVRLGWATSGQPLVGSPWEGATWRVYEEHAPGGPTWHTLPAGTMTLSEALKRLEA